MTERRKYDSPIRRQQAADTRDRILAAGSDLAHGFDSWNWKQLTVRAVAERAGVSPKTVYRHVGDDAALRAAVLQQLYEEAGIGLESMALPGFGDVITQVFEYLSSFAADAKPLGDPAFVEMDERRRLALLDAVRPSVEGWAPTDQAIVAAVLDVLWLLPTYERLRTAWQLDAGDAARAARWVVGLVEQAVAEGQRPPADG